MLIIPCHYFWPRAYRQGDLSQHEDKNEMESGVGWLPLFYPLRFLCMRLCLLGVV